MSDPRPCSAFSASPHAHPGGGFLTGIGDVWRGSAFLMARPRLWIWAAIPFVLNVLLFLAVAWGGWHFFGQWLDQQFFHVGQHWWSAPIGWLLGVLFWIVLGLLVLFCFVPLATVVAAPFNDVLSDRVERLYAGAGVDEPFSPRLLARGLWVGMTGSLLLALKTIGLMLLALPLYLLPPPLGGVLGPAAQAAITVRFLALEHTSYSMDRRRYTYRQKDRFLRVNRGRTLGMGTMSFLVMMIPLLNALFISVSAVAGTLLFCDTELRRED